MGMDLRKVYVMYPGGLHKAFTMSYDDGNDCDIPLVEIMRRHHVKGTFNINFCNCPPARMAHDKHPWSRLPLDELIDLYGDDMEIAMHGFTHPTWDRMPSPAAMQDILDDRRALEQATGRIIRGSAFPNGTYNQDTLDILRLAGFAYCRDVITTGDFGRPPQTLLPLQGTTRNRDPHCLDLARKFAADHNITRHLRFFYLWGHSYEFIQDNSWGLLEELLDIVSDREDVWYATNIEIVDYLSAAEQLRYDVMRTRVFNPTTTPIWLRVAHGSDAVFVVAEPGKTVAIPE